MRTTSFLLLLALLAASCTKYSFEEQHVLVKPVQDEDALELLIVYEAIEADEASDNSRSEGAHQVAADAGGYRHFTFVDWPWEFDLPEMERRGERDLLESNEVDSVATQVERVVGRGRILKAPQRQGGGSPGVQAERGTERRVGAGVSIE